MSTEEVADQFLVADNRFGELSHSHEGRRRELLASFDDTEFAAPGFLPAEITKLFAEVSVSRPLWLLR